MINSQNIMPRRCILFEGVSSVGHNMPFYARSRVFPLAELHQTRVLSQWGGSSFFFSPDDSCTHILASNPALPLPWAHGSSVCASKADVPLYREGITALATTGASRDERRLTFLRRSGSFLMRNCNVSIIREDVQGQGELS